MKLMKALFTALAIAGVMTTTAFAAETVQLNGYGGSSDYISEYQLSISNVTGTSDVVYVEGTPTYTATAPATVTLLDDIFLFEVRDILGDTIDVSVGVTHDGFGPEYDFKFDWERTDDNKYDEMILMCDAGRTVTLTAPGVYYVTARYEAIAGATDAVIVVTEGPAKYTSSKVLIDGNEVGFEAYNLNDNNYFKLRDSAMALNGTPAQFSIAWDAESNTIIVEHNPYEPVGGELTLGDGTDKIAYKSSQKLLAPEDGGFPSYKAYNINGNNYFKLRDIGDLFGFEVDWDAASICIIVNTDY
ncbi:MAG: hypothetical protein IJ366_07015 [Clostridia bacterium]|nr:hypothetical protein [Clostridia bacterium]